MIIEFLLDPVAVAGREPFAVAARGTRRLSQIAVQGHGQRSHRRLLALHRFPCGRQSR